MADTTAADVHFYVWNDQDAPADPTSYVDMTGCIRDDGNNNSRQVKANRRLPEASSDKQEELEIAKPSRRRKNDSKKEASSCLPWWSPVFISACVFTLLLILSILSGPFRAIEVLEKRSWLSVSCILHIPLYGILFYLSGGIVERVGFFWLGRKPQEPGKLPTAESIPHVCIQLPMFNEHAVAQRVIRAACAVRWPRDRFEVQVLDDSTDTDSRRLAEEVCSEMQEKGIKCYVRHRVDRKGYKAGALEEGRKQTGAEFLAIFDADFLPTTDYLERAIPFFYDKDAKLKPDLALVQAQWGHLNPNQSLLTMAQALWVDDHHTLQLSWRSTAWGFTNFTGTAGVWLAEAIEKAGGWSSTSLVEDCELSFRHLFEGYRTQFVKEIVVPSELPATYTAYKAQQRRWTMGWVQLQRLHMKTLLYAYKASFLKKFHLFYHMTIGWQWPLWGIWALEFPLLIYHEFWFVSVGNGWLGVLVYFVPFMFWICLTAAAASLETKYTYERGHDAYSRFMRFLRVVPYMVISSGMLPHQLCSFVEGLFGPMDVEFERTPKAGGGEANIVGSNEESNEPVPCANGLPDLSTDDHLTASSHSSNGNSIILGDSNNRSNVLNPSMSGSASPATDDVSSAPSHRSSGSMTNELGSTNPSTEGEGDESSNATKPDEPQVPAKKNYRVKVHWPYVLTELFFICYLVAWAVLFFLDGNRWCGTGSLYISLCVSVLVFCYGDHLGRCLFVIPNPWSS